MTPSPKMQRTTVLNALQGAYSRGLRDGVFQDRDDRLAVAKELMESLTGHCAADEAKSCFNCAETCKCECLGCTLAKTT